MPTLERLNISGLSVAILQSAFRIGFRWSYKVILRLLSRRESGLTSWPHGAQVETRIVIVSLGLIIALTVSSTTFWLTLLSFGAITAWQFPQRNALLRPPSTIPGLITLAGRIQARQSI